MTLGTKRLTCFMAPLRPMASSNSPIHRLEAWMISGARPMATPRDPMTFMG